MYFYCPAIVIKPCILHLSLLDLDWEYILLSSSINSDDNVNRHAPGLTTWQWAGVHIEPTQQVIIARVNGHVLVIGDLCVIPFYLLFLRQPAAAESDIVLHQQGLVPFAEFMWRFKDLSSLQPSTLNILRCP